MRHDPWPAGSHDARSPRGRSLLPRVVPAVVAGSFAAIGLVVIVSLWSMRGFGAPPLPFKLIGTIMGMVFVVVGCGAAATIARGGRTSQPPPAAPPAAGYECPGCGATLAGDVDVSPHGDVKCAYCDAWFNIHGRRAR
ncbi:MAG: hypothetical protein ACYTJ0_12920 [Planctomycetota bacterium]|jgi:hypothetical protein